MALNRGNKRYSDVLSKDEYIKSLQPQGPTADDELVEQLKQRTIGNAQTAGLLSDYLVNKGTGLSNETLNQYIRNTFTRPQTVPNTTNTTNPVPTATTVQQEQTAMSEEQRRANLAANASYQRMLKYLPQLQKENGYAGLGISEAGKAEAWNDLQTRLAQIAMNYGAMEDQKADATSQAAMNAAYSELQEATTADEASEILNRYRKFLSPSDAELLSAMSESNSQKAIYQQYADQAAGYNGSVGATFDSNGQNKGLSAGDNFRIKGPDGTIYYIESGGKVNDADIVNTAKRHNDGDVFKYGNNLYMVKDGGVYLVQRRKNSEAKSYQALLSLYSGM